jgi:hypothetical protein
VANCSIKEAGAKALAEGTAFRALTPLDLRENKIGDAGAAALAQGHFPELRHLTLAKCGIGDVGAIALASSPLLATVDVLDIHSNRIGDAGAKALLESPHLGRVRELRGIAPAELQRDRMLRGIEVEVARDVAVHQRGGRHHLGVEARVARYPAEEEPAVPVRPVHHRGDAKSMRRRAHALDVLHARCFRILTCAWTVSHREGDFVRAGTTGIDLAGAARSVAEV